MAILIGSISFIVITSLIGVYLSRNVHTVKGFALANRSLPLYVSTGTVFATWFGAESVMGVPESFMEHGIVGVISDPIGAFICLLFLGMFFARRFYNMNLISLVDFFYNRFGKTIEVLMGIAISFSYMGWIAAQFTAFGTMISFISNHALSLNNGIILASFIIILYTFKGGMLAVAINDFIQTIIISFSLTFIFFFLVPKAGGLFSIYDYAVETHRMSIHFSADYPNYTYLGGVLLSMILGSIPQQDTFQRITSAKSAEVAVCSTILGGVIYFLITMLPICIVLAAAKLQHLDGETTPENFNAYILHLVTNDTPGVVQFFFFGSLFAAILSTASGTILATSVVLSRNVLGELFPKEGTLLVTRLTLVMVTLAVCIFAMTSGNSIHELVEDSSKVSMVTAFFPLVLGMFWKKTSYIAVFAAIILSTGTWIFILLYERAMGTYFTVAPELIGALISCITIVIGSFLFPDSRDLRDEIIHHRHIQ